MTFEFFPLLGEQVFSRCRSCLLSSSPYLFQRFAEAVLDEINLALNIDGIAYLDDWLLHSTNPEDLQTALEMIDVMGITVNQAKSVLIPTGTSYFQYIGFKINSVDMIIQFTLSEFDRLQHILR